MTILEQREFKRSYNATIYVDVKTKKSMFILAF